MRSPAEIGPDLQRLSRAVLRRAALIVGDAEAAVDVARDVFERALQGGAFDAPDTFNRLYHLTTVRSLARLRDRGPGALDDAAAPVRAVLARGRARETTLAAYVWLDGMSIEQITAMTGTPSSIIAKNLERFRKKAAAAGTPLEAPTVAGLRHPSDYEFDRLIAEDLAPQPEAHLEKHARFCPPCSARLETLRAASTDSAAMRLFGALLGLAGGKRPGLAFFRSGGVQGVVLAVIAGLALVAIAAQQCSGG